MILIFFTQIIISYIFGLFECLLLIKIEKEREKERMTSCSNCDSMFTKYTQSTKDCERLLDKLRDYQHDLDQCQAWISEQTRRQKEANLSHESNLKSLIDRLDELATRAANNESANIIESVILYLNLKY